MSLQRTPFHWYKKLIIHSVWRQKLLNPIAQKLSEFRKHEEKVKNRFLIKYNW
jgi:hypothetical protein